MKNFVFFCLFSLTGTTAFAQKVDVSGTASDTSKGAFAIEIVINDTLSKLMKDPKNNRPKYLKIYQDPRFVVRTDSSGKFSIKANPNDSLYFKSYHHKTEVYLVKDLLKNDKINIVLKRDPAVITE